MIKTYVGILTAEARIVSILDSIHENPQTKDRTTLSKNECRR